jgi:hypothetical protein
VAQLPFCFLTPPAAATGCWPAGCWLLLLLLLLLLAGCSCWLRLPPPQPQPLPPQLRLRLQRLSSLGMHSRFATGGTRRQRCTV